MTNLADLEIFARVVASGSMSAAGRELGLQPAIISKRIKRLEERLGTRLFQRTTRQISLTEAGEGFHERVVAALAGLEEAEAFVLGRSGEVRGRLKVSAPTSFGRMHIAPHLKALFDRYPELSIQLILTDEFQDIVAEGVETAAEMETLREIGVQAAQGYHLAHPLSQADLLARLPDTFPPAADLRSRWR